VQDPFFTHVVFPIYVAALIWIGLLLRDARVRALVAQAFAPRLVADVELIADN
jgi:hypothetical protein